MLIRSQDKKIIANLSNLTYMDIYERNSNQFVVKAHFPYTGEILGAYSTEEKAIKVLDMIQDDYKKVMFGPGGKDALTGEMFQPFGFIPPKVFYMPQDAEVDV